MKVMYTFHLGLKLSKIWSTSQMAWFSRNFTWSLSSLNNPSTKLEKRAHTWICHTSSIYAKITNAIWISITIFSFRHYELKIKWIKSAFLVLIRIPKHTPSWGTHVENAEATSAIGIYITSTSIWYLNMNYRWDHWIKNIIAFGYGAKRVSIRWWVLQIPSTHG